MNLALSDFTENILNHSFEWLHDPEIKFLTKTPDITKEQQLIWFKSLKDRKDYLVKAINVIDEPVGVVGLKKICTLEKKAEYFGYIGNKAYWGKGIGDWMLNKALELAIAQDLEKVYLNVIIENYKAINLYFKTGFKIVSYNESCYLMEKKLK